MKKLLLIPVFFLFLGCERYDMFTHPQHKFNGIWNIKSIRFNIVSCTNCNTQDSASIRLINTDTVALSAFRLNRIQNGRIILNQDIATTPFSRLFKIDRNGFNSTRWEIETYQMSTFYDGTTNGKLDCWVNYYPTGDKTGYIEVKDLQKIGNRSPAVTKWGYIVEGGTGVAPADLLTLTSPPVTTDLLIENRLFEKMITYKLIIEFMR